jgi:hypothetical protein
MLYLQPVIRIINEFNKKNIHMKNFRWKKFIVAFIIAIPLVLLLDVLYDKIFKQLIWSDIFAADNLFFKTATAAIIAYFYTLLSTKN